MKSVSFLSLLLVALALPLQANAFMVAPPTAQSSTATFVSTIYSDFDTAEPARALTAGNGKEDLKKFTTPITNSRAANKLQFMDMPRHGPSETEIATAKAIASLEMTVGRGAMLVALGLMVTEVSTGMSLPEQLSKFFS